MKELDIKTQRDVKVATNDDLIFWLCQMFILESISKANRKILAWICRELKSRGVLLDEESFMKEWLRY